MICYFQKSFRSSFCDGSSWWQVKESAWTKKGEHWTNWIYGNLECVFVFSGGWEEIQQTWCEKGRTWEGKTLAWLFYFVIPWLLWNPSLVNCKLQVPKRVVVPSGRPRGRPKSRTTEGLGRPKKPEWMLKPKVPYVPTGRPRGRSKKTEWSQTMRQI